MRKWALQASSNQFEGEIACSVELVRLAVIGLGSCHATSGSLGTLVVWPSAALLSLGAVMWCQLH